MLRPFFPELVMSTDLLSFERPSVLLFCSDNSQIMDYWFTIRHRCSFIWSWTEMLTVSFQPRAKTVWIPLRSSTEMCRLGEGHNECPSECRLSVGTMSPKITKMLSTRNTCIWMISYVEKLKDLMFVIRLKFEDLRCSKNYFEFFKIWLISLLE